MKAIGIDIGGTRVKAGLVTRAGEVMAMRSLRSPDSLAEMRAAVVGVAGALADSQPYAVGLGCRGIIDFERTRVEALPGALSYLEGTTFRDWFPQAAVVAADNDARVAMAGEMMWGAARGRSNALMLTLGTGVGGAVLCEGRLLRGAAGVAGHLGHLTIDPDGPLCICGNRGCIETFFSARAIESEAFAAAHRGCDSALTTRFRESGGRLECEEVFAAAAAGDSVALEIVTRATRFLGGGIAGLVHAFDPEVVILGGQISGAGDLLFEHLRAEVWRRTRRLLRRDVPLIPSELSDPSGVAGAAALVMKVVAEPG